MTVSFPGWLLKFIFQYPPYVCITYTSFHLTPEHKNVLKRYETLYVKGTGGILPGVSSRPRLAGCLPAILGDVVHLVVCLMEDLTHLVFLNT